jgi:uroporphyrinogen decarboxylase
MMATDPDWLRDMYEADMALLEAAWEDLWSRELRPDALWIFGDIAYRNGLLFSPRHYRQVLMPFHRRLCDLAHRHNCQVIYHSDGNVTQAIPLLVECGIDCLHPLEVKAGMDVATLKQEWGDRLAFMGNIDARLFQANDRAGLEVEIRAKVPVAMKGGGYIYHSDHSVPPGTTLDTYRFAMDLVRRYGNYS